jgi:hypothetical protein
MQSNKDIIEELVIIYPNMQYDIESVLEIVDLWKVPAVAIYVIEDFDPKYMQNEEEPIGMPHNLEKLQMVLRRKLQKIGANIFEDTIKTDSSSDEKLSEGLSEGYDAECWILKFTMVERIDPREERIKKGKKAREPRIITFTLNYFYDIDPFGDSWPSMEDAHILLHTNGPLDPEIVGELVENPYNIEVYGTREMLENVWHISDEINPINEGSDIYLYGNLGDHLAQNDSSD